MQPKNQNAPNPKRAANQPKPGENFPGKAPDVYGDETRQKPGHTPGQNPKRDKEHNPDRGRGAQHQNPDQQRRDHRDDPARKNERAHRPGQDRA